MNTGAWYGQLHFVVALVAVLDPFMAVPVFLNLCAHRSGPQRARLARVVSLTVCAVLLGAAFSGETILQILGTSLASFRVAGGFVLFLMAISMLQAHPGNVRQTAEEAEEASDNALRDGRGIVPLAIPLLAGPGAISTVMIAAHSGSDWQKLQVCADVALVCVILWLALRLALPLGKLLGTTGLNIASRLLGLLLAAIAVESIAWGIKALFPFLRGT